MDDGHHYSSSSPHFLQQCTFSVSLLCASTQMLAMLTRHLKPDTGLALSAGKRYYFGTGGSVASLIEKATAVGFQAHVVDSIEDGKSNIRDIVLIRWA